MNRLGIGLIAGGAAVWTAGAVAWISGVWVTLPPDTVRVLVLTLSAVSGGLLVMAGALIGRRRYTVPAAVMAEQGSESAPQLGEGVLPEFDFLRARRASVDERVT
jgi:hypothetical protein